MIRSLTIPPTLKGLLALVLWSTSATAISFLKIIPPYEILMISCLMASGFTLAKVTIYKEWATLKAPLLSWIIVTCCIVVQQFLYVSAISYAEPAEVDILVYLWPAMTILLSTLLFKDSIKSSHILCMILGFSSVLLLLGGKVSLNNFSAGHLCAILCALTWALYSALASRRQCIHPNMIGIAYSVGFIISLFLHAEYEAFILPSLTQIGILAYLGIALTFGAFALWTAAIQPSNARFLSLSAYMKPILSLTLLSTFGYADLSWKMGLACFLVVFSGIMARYDLSLNLREWFINWQLSPAKSSS